MMRHNNARGGGSMMSPDIQELELELQLLKRKRQLLQQQQVMLIGGQHSNRERQRDYNYDQSSQMYNQQQGSQDFNFSQLYDDRVTGSGDRGRQFGQKRPTTDPWQSGIPAKRTFGSKGRYRSAPASRPAQGYGSNRGESKFGQRSTADQRPLPPRNVDARPSFGNNNARSGPSFNRGPRKNFNSNRVTKPRAVSPPNKLSSYSRSERKKLVDEASKPIDDDSIILTADKPPNPTMSGRMELALGNILKELRQDFGGNEKYSEIFTNDRLVKVVKQTLRERIRDVMIGKSVTGMKFIISSYREKYTKETDQEIIDNAMEVADATRRENKLAIRLVESETPENYFRLNMGKLLDVKLNEMFKKLETLYEDENCEKLQDIIDAQIPSLSTEEESGKEKYDPEVALESSDAANDETVNDNVVNEANVNDTSANDVPINETTNNTNPSTEEDKDISINDSNKIEDSQTEENKTDKLNETNPNEELSESDAKFIKSWKLCNQKYFNSEFYDKLINHNLKYKLPRILPRYKDMILNILDVDKQYRATKAAIVSRVGGKIDKKANAESKLASRKTSDGQRLPINYYVKVVGRPGLPKRKAMSKFLEDFNPLTIKKHKAVHNLLFIGLHAKEDFDRILAATGTQIGNVTLTIAVSERNNQANKSIENNGSKQTEDNKDEGIKDEPSKEVNNEELDNQILDSVDNDESEVKGDPQLETIDEKPEENVENKQIDASANNEAAENFEVIEEQGKSVKTEANIGAETQNENSDNKVEVTKADAKDAAAATPTRSSTRLAASTPNTVRTRRTSKLAQ